MSQQSKNLTKDSSSQNRTTVQTNVEEQGSGEQNTTLQQANCAQSQQSLSQDYVQTPPQSQPQSKPLSLHGVLSFAKKAFSKGKVLLGLIGIQPSSKTNLASSQSSLGHAQAPAQVSPTQEQTRETVQGEPLEEKCLSEQDSNTSLNSLQSADNVINAEQFNKPKDDVFFEPNPSAVNSTASLSASEPRAIESSSAPLVKSLELVRVVKSGLYAFPVQSKQQLLKDNAAKIALIHRVVEATDDEWQNIMLPMIHGCLKLCMTMPASDVNHDSRTGGLFAHSLNVGYSSISDCMSYLEFVEGNNCLRLDNAFNLYQQLNDELKALLSNKPCVIDIDRIPQNKLDRLEHLEAIFKTKICHSLNPQSALAQHYAQRFQALADFDRTYLDKVPPEVRKVWASFLTDANSLQAGQKVQTELLGQSGQSGQSEQAGDNHASLTDEQVLQLRYQRLKLLASLLPLPKFSVKDFEQLMSLSHEDRTARLECLVLKERYFLNLLGDLSFGLWAENDFVPHLNSEFAKTLRANREKFNLHLRDIDLHLSFNKSTSLYIIDALTELERNFPFLNSYQRAFALSCCCLFFALAHDIGKVIFDMNIYSEQGLQHNPHKASLDQFIQQSQTRVLLVEYDEARSCNHIFELANSCMLLARECPESFAFVSQYFNVDELLSSYVRSIEKDHGKKTGLNQDEATSALDMGLIKQVLAHDVFVSLSMRDASFIDELIHKLLLGLLVDRYFYAQYISQSSNRAGESFQPESDLKLGELNQDRQDNQDRCAELSGGDTKATIAQDGLQEMSVHDWLQQGQALNNPYADLFVSDTRVFLTKGSRAYFKWLLLIQETTLGNIQAQDILHAQDHVESLKLHTFEQMSFHDEACSFHKVRCGDSIVLAKGMHLRPVLFDAKLPVESAECEEIVGQNLVVDVLMKNVAKSMRAILNAFADCQDYAQQTRQKSRFNVYVSKGKGSCRRLNKGGASGLVAIGLGSKLKGRLKSTGLNRQGRASPMSTGFLTSRGKHSC